MKYFIVTDVHSYYDLMIYALDKAGFDKDNPDHIFVSLGDLLDRGHQPRECLQFVNSLKNKILIRGNHEDLMEDMLLREQALKHDYHNGTFETLCLLTNTSVKNVYLAYRRLSKDKDYVEYEKSLVDCFDDGKNVFVHGWIPCDPITFKVSDNWEHGDWSKARWINGMEAWSKGARLEGKTVYCGHFHTSWGHCHIHRDCPEFNTGDVRMANNGIAMFTPFIDNGIVALDACTAYSGFVNCFVVEA